MHLNPTRSMSKCTIEGNGGGGGGGTAAVRGILYGSTAADEDGGGINLTVLTATRAVYCGTITDDDKPAGYRLRGGQAYLRVIADILGGGGGAAGGAGSGAAAGGNEIRLSHDTNGALEWVSVVVRVARVLSCV